ncbi:MAG: hypothetical protein KGM24_12945 [Elusimicrobia bacterium]|nr:hypothetical protein [Elusimicrobiota bacterium]
MVPDKASSKGEHRCVECRWCERVESAGSAMFRCADTGEKFSEFVALHHPVCRAFELPPAVPYWGP